MSDLSWSSCSKGSCHRHQRCMYFKHPLCPATFRSPQQGTEEQPWADPMPETPMPDGPQ